MTFRADASRRSIVQAAAIAVALWLAMASPTPAQEVFEQEKGVFAARELRASAPIKTGERLIIRAATTLSGQITITTSPDNMASVVYTKRAETGSRSRAVDYIDLIAVDISRVPEGARLQLRAPNPAPWSGNESGSVEAEIQVPEGVLVDIEALYFDIVATGPFSGIIIPSSLGRLEISRVDGRVELATANRKVGLKEITGDISVQTSNSSLIASQIASPKGQAVFRNDGGEIRIDGFIGEISARNDFGRIEITNFTPTGRRNVIRGQSAPIVLELSELGSSQLVVSNRLEDIDITVPSELSGVLTLAVDTGGRIEVSSLKFQTDLVQRDRLGIVVGDGDGFISGSISGRGNIYIRGHDQGEN